MIEYIIWFKKNYPELVKEMKNCNHALDDTDSNPYHIEDDVWTHTMMVCKEAEKYSEIVKIACLLHDIGKIYAREVKDDKVRFFGHEGISVFSSISILKHMQKDFQLTDKEVLKILNIISLHGSLWDLIDKPEAIVNKFFCMESFFNTIFHVKCDSSGRFFTSNNPRDKMLRSELGNSILGYEDFSKHFKQKQPVYDKPILEVLVGLPGSGKSTYANNQYARIISRDSYIINHNVNQSYNENWKELTEVQHRNIDASVEREFRTAVKNGENIIIDMTNMSPKSRRKWLKAAPQHRTQCTVFYTSLEVCGERRNSCSGKYISPEVFKSMASRFTVPTADECDNVQYILN